MVLKQIPLCESQTLKERQNKVSILPYFHYLAIYYVNPSMHQNVVAEISEAWVLMSLNLCWLVFVIEDFPVLVYVNPYLAPEKKNQHSNLTFLGKVAQSVS